MVYEKSGFRIKKYSKGYLVEIEKSKWALFGIKKYWVHYVSYGGLSEHPFYYDTFETALKEMLKKIKYEILSK